MAERKAISTRTRFEVFKRDGFRCVYCGNTPTQCPLHVDHVVPVADGGTNKTSNLVTACDKCNLGKSSVPLDRKKLAPQKTAADLRDHAAQIMAFLAAQRELEAAQDTVCDELAQCWQERIGPLSQDMYGRLATLIQQWPIERLREAIFITGRKLGLPNSDFHYWTATKQAKYFHGILRRWREEEQGQ